MRCPNPGCRKVFKATPSLAGPPAAKPPAAKLRPKSNTKNVGDVVPVIDAQVVPPPKPATPPVADGEMPAFVDAVPVDDEAPTPKPAPPPPVPRQKKPRQPEPKVVDAVVVAKPQPKVVDAVVVPKPQPIVVEAVVVADEPAAKEVVWTPDADVPGGSTAPAVEEPSEEPLFIPRRRKKKKKKWPVYLLIGMAGVIVIALGYTVLIGLKRIGDAEYTLAQQAEKQYKDGEYGAAAKTYTQLVAEFPSSDSRPKYEFYSDLAILQRDVRSVTTRDEPGPAIAKMLSFLDVRKDSPWMKTDGGAGGDVVAAGRKVAEDTAGHAEDRIKDYRKDRSKSAELKRASDAVGRGRELLAKLDPMRASADEPFDGLRIRFDQIARDIDAENRRSQGMEEIRALIARPTDASVEAARAKLAEYGLGGDPEAARLVSDASGMLGRLVHYTPSPAAPVDAPKNTSGALAFTAPIGATVPPESGASGERKPGVFLAPANGVVYALDEDTGNFLWAARVGSGVSFPPTIAELPGAEAGLAVLVSNVAGKPAVAGHDLRTGARRWYQPLPAVPAGSALVVGKRVYTPLHDLDGTLVELDATTGQRLGVLALGQAIGPPPVVRAGTGLIYVVADARRVYVLDAAARDVEGNSLPPRCAQVLLTGHLPGSVRTPPLILGPTGDAVAERWLVLSQVAAPTEMRLRPFALPPLSPPTSDGIAPPGIAVGAAVTVSVPGWSEILPTTDGERLALVTDAGELRLFGVNQPGNRDAALFPIPQQLPPHTWTGPPTPGAAIPADDGGFWLLANGQDAQLVRIDLNPEKGLLATVVPRSLAVGKVALAGVPLQPVAFSTRSNTAFLVVRSPDSNSIRAVAFDPSAGEVRWQRQLGIDGAAAAGSAESGAVLAGESGAIQHVPAEGAALPAGLLHRSDSAELLCEPLDGTAGRTTLVTSANGQSCTVLTSYRRKNEDWLAVRMIVGGKPERNGRVRIDSTPSGRVAFFGDAAIYPARDGFVYRVAWNAPAVKDEGGFERITVQRGPQWRTSESRNPNGVCFLTPLDADRLAVCDGDRTVAVWVWPAGGVEQPTGIRWVLPQPIALEPAYLAGRNEQPAALLIADSSGSVWQFAADRAGEPLQRWKPDGKVVPLGKPTAGFAVQPAASGDRWAAYVIDQRHVAFLKLDGGPAFTGVSVRGEDRAERAIVGVPQPAPGGRWLLTDLGGRVRLIDPLNPPREGQVALRSEVGLPGVVPVDAGTMAGPSRVVVPLSDGTAAVLMLPEK